jgi:hypothetical protein
MGFLDPMDVQVAGVQEWDEAGLLLERGTLSHQFHVQAAFFLRFPKRRLLRILVQLDVPPDRKPAVELLVVDEEDPGVTHDEDGDGKIDEFMEMGHEAIINEKRRR